MSRFTLDPGTEIRVSSAKSSRNIFVALALIPAGGFSTLIGLLIAWQQKVGLWDWVKAFGFVLCGLFIIAIGLAMLFVVRATAKGNRRFVIGQKAFQQLTPHAEVTIHVPYDNIKKLNLREQWDDVNQRMEYTLDIRVRDPDRLDTMVPDELRIEEGKRSVLLILDDFYEVPLPAVHAELLEHCLEARDRAAAGPIQEIEDAEQQQEYKARRARRKRPLFSNKWASVMVGLGCAGVVVGTGALVGIVAMMGYLVSGRGNPPPVVGDGPAPVVKGNPLPVGKGNPPPLVKGGPAPRQLPDEGPVVFLADLTEFDVKRGPWPFTKNGQIGDGKTWISVEGFGSPKGLGMVPPQRDYAAAKFRMEGRGAMFKTTAALDDTGNGRLSAAEFEVLGDGKSLWKSPPVARARQVHVVALDIADVQELELRVHTPGHFDGLRAVWVEPRVVLKK